jgi:hypothetical protein
VKVETDSTGSEKNPIATSCEHGKDTSGSTQGGEFVNQLKGYIFLKKSTVFHEGNQ